MENSIILFCFGNILLGIVQGRSIRDQCTQYTADQIYRSQTVGSNYIFCGSVLTADKKMIRCVIALSSLFGIVESYRGHRFFSNCLHATTSASSTTTNGGITERVPSESNQKSDTADWSTLFVNALIKSPLYTPIVALARNTMIKTAASVGVDWKGKALSLREINTDWQSGIESIKAQRRPDYVTPPYYMQPFHGYKEGNLCLDAALEQELAGTFSGKEKPYR